MASRVRVAASACLVASGAVHRWCWRRVGLRRPQDQWPWEPGRAERAERLRSGDADSVSALGDWTSGNDQQIVRTPASAAQLAFGSGQRDERATVRTKPTSHRQGRPREPRPYRRRPPKTTTQTTETPPRPRRAAESADGPRPWPDPSQPPGQPTGCGRAAAVAAAVDRPLAALQPPKRPEMQLPGELQPASPVCPAGRCARRRRRCGGGRGPRRPSGSPSPCR